MIRIRQIKLPIEKDNIEELKKQISKKLKININVIKNIKISKKSLDARQKPNLLYIYEVDVELDKEHNILNKNKDNNDIFKTPNEKYIMPSKGEKTLKKPPVIIGSGPAGLFCAYILSEQGYNPIIIERGEKTEDRVKTVENFWETGELKIESNVQFGEGGAGTFSDGKLNTLTKDKENRCKKVFETFVECGANEDILYLNNPHIGTDILREVVINLRNKILKNGGKFLYNSCLTKINVSNNKINSIEINNKEILETELLVLAIGHSARDTFEMLLNNGVYMESKPFAVGLRVQHPQELINKNQYGDNYPKFLPAANYKLTYQTSTGRGVYSFCMCPGGHVVNASSEEGHLAINGMSYHDRGSKNANSAIVVTVNPKDYGEHPLDGIKFQRELEKKTYKIGDGKIPIQLLKDFHNNVENYKLGNISPVFKGGYKLVNLNKILPSYISESLKEALINFDNKIKGFNDGDAILAAIESRTSSPVKIPRNEEFISNIEGIYPCGEGAGYAGGITTSAIDGIKVAESIIKKYK